jgi:TolA-binding protein
MIIDINKGIRVFAITLIILVLFIFSCAYFNTLYNARKIYNQAEKNRIERGESRALNDQYNKVVEKCSKLIRDYPDSKWVDDAVFLMGKALVRSGDYDKGLKKFRELMDNFPDSDYVPKSYYWLAYTHAQKEEYNKALQYVKDFLESYKQHEYRDRILMLGGDINSQREDSEEAMEFYGMVAEETSSDEVLEKARLNSADLYFENEQWELAAVAYEKVLRKGLSEDKRRRILTAMGKCYSRIGKCQKSMDIFEDLLEETASIKEQPELLMGKAEAFICSDSLMRAIEVYERVTDKFPNSKYSAEAFYRVGLIYHEELDSLSRAQEAFSKVSKEFANSEYAAISLQRSNSLKRLIDLEESAGDRGTEEKRYQKLLSAAEIQLTQLEEVDEALQKYKALVDSFPQADVAPRAGYAIAWIYHHKMNDEEKAVDGYREVVLKYPRSYQARGAIIQIGVLGHDSLKTKMQSYVDSALADTTWMEIKSEPPDSMKSVTSDSTLVPPDTANVSVPVDNSAIEPDSANALPAYRPGGTSNSLRAVLPADTSKGRKGSSERR